MQMYQKIGCRVLGEGLTHRPIVPCPLNLVPITMILYYRKYIMTKFYKVFAKNNEIVLSLQSNL